MSTPMKIVKDSRSYMIVSADPTETLDTDLRRRAECVLRTLAVKERIECVMLVVSDDPRHGEAILLGKRTACAFPKAPYATWFVNLYLSTEGVFCGHYDMDLDRALEDFRQRIERMAPHAVS